MEPMMLRRQLQSMQRSCTCRLCPPSTSPTLRSAILHLSLIQLQWSLVHCVTVCKTNCLEQELFACASRLCPDAHYSVLPLGAKFVSCSSVRPCRCQCSQHQHQFYANPSPAFCLSIKSVEFYQNLVSCRRKGM